MKLPIFQVDAFAHELFTGNPAAVVVLKDWLEDSILQNISKENNLAETAFVVAMPNFYEIRWFTPTTEIDLCGHATLAAAYVICNFIKPNTDKVIFKSNKSGELRVKKVCDLYELDFPTDKLVPYGNQIPEELLLGIGDEPIEFYKGNTDCLLVFETAAQIKKLKPDFCQLAKVNHRGIIVTAPGTDTDFVSRFFAPQIGINEDPVTGSAHTTLIPYWKEKTGKIEFTARQLSERGGYLQCVYVNDRVKILGEAKLYLKGEICVC